MKKKQKEFEKIQETLKISKDLLHNNKVTKEKNPQEQNK